MSETDLRRVRRALLSVSNPEGLAEFAGTLKKGAHLMVEGELRSRKYDSKKSSTS